MDQTKHLGMQHWFEMYMLGDKYDREAWQNTLFGISQYIGFLKSWKLIVQIENSTVRYFVGTNKLPTT